MPRAFKKEDVLKVLKTIHVPHGSECHPMNSLSTCTGVVYMCACGADDMNHSLAYVNDYIEADQAVGRALKGLELVRSALHTLNWDDGDDEPLLTALACAEAMVRGKVDSV